MNQFTILSINHINSSSPVTRIESLINQSFMYSPIERSYSLQCIQQLITDTLPMVHTLHDTKRLIILYRFINSVLSH